MSTGKYFEEAKKGPQYLAALSVCLGSVAAGCVLGWTSNISSELEQRGLNDIELNGDDLGWIGSFVTLGALVMCFPIGYICDKIGRKKAMLALIVPFMLGWLLIIFAQNVQMIFVGRFITGMAGGAFCISAPMYTSEIAQKEIRGALGSYFQLLLTVGILISYMIAYIASVKVYTIICAIFPLIFGVAFIFQPETPIYCVKKGRYDEARQALIKLRGERYDVESELNEIKSNLEAESKMNKKLSEVLKTRAAKKAALIAFGLMFFQQMSGINAVIFYTGSIFESAGADLNPKIATILVGLMQVIATFVSSLVIDKLGRKVLLIGSDLLMAISGLLLALFFTLSDRELVEKDVVSSLGFLPVLSMCIFIIVFSLGYGPIPWMISSEVFPPEIKTVASSAAGTFNWFMAFIVTKFYLNLKESIGGDGAFYLFSAFSIVGTLFVVLFVPETKGKSLEEIQNELNGDIKPSSTGVDNLGYAS